jgi:hypothetical protein
MGEVGENMEIIDIYYADCDQNEGPEPRWSTARLGDQLTDERSLNMLRNQLRILQRKRKKLVFAFGEEVIEVQHPRSASVKSLLQRILELPAEDSSLDELKQFGDVLAQKYLRTPYSRTRLFMVARVVMKGEQSLFTLVADLKPEFAGEYIEPKSLDFTSQTIPNWIGELKKGAIYPTVTEGRLDEDSIIIYDKQRTRYYPQSLECVPKQSAEMEARSLLGVVGGVARISPDQAASVLRRLRQLDCERFGSSELAGALRGSGIEVEPEQVDKEWRRRFYSTGYEISPAVLSSDSVAITIRLDEFEIRCPLSYYPDRIEQTQEGGYHYVRLKGREFTELRAGEGRIQFRT